MKIYVASSWKNKLQPVLVEWLCQQGHEVYNFRKPRPGEHGFKWDQIDPGWKDWSIDEYRTELKNPTAESGYQSDLCGMEWADVFIIVNPSGRSAHIEAGWAIGKGKPTAIMLYENDKDGPDLMYKLASALVKDYDELKAWLNSVRSA